MTKRTSKIFSELSDETLFKIAEDILVFPFEVDLSLREIVSEIYGVKIEDVTNEQVAGMSYPLMLEFYKRYKYNKT